MKIGDLVRPNNEHPDQDDHPDNEFFIGIVIGWDAGFSHKDPVVFWNDRFPQEIEYTHQLEVIG